MFPILCSQYVCFLAWHNSLSIIYFLNSFPSHDCSLYVGPTVLSPKVDCSQTAELFYRHQFSCTAVPIRLVYKRIFLNTIFPLRLFPIATFSCTIFPWDDSPNCYLTVIAVIACMLTRARFSSFVIANICFSNFTIYLSNTKKTIKRVTTN